MSVLSMLLAAVFAVAPTDAAASQEEDAPAQPEAEHPPTSEPNGDESRSRRFMIGLEGVGMQVPALRSPVVALDPRFAGETVAMGGLGAFGRMRVVPLVGFDLGVRSGSVRYRDDRAESGSLVSQDLLMAEAGVDLFVARGDVGHLGLEAGGGGMFNRIRYELGTESDESTQTFGSGFVRAGIGAELLTRRIAFVFSLRWYAVMTDPGSAKNRGPAFDGLPEASRKTAVSGLQTFVAGSLGVAYRF